MAAIIGTILVLAASAIAYTAYKFAKGNK